MTARRSHRIQDGAWRGWAPDTGPAPQDGLCGRVLALDGRFERSGEPGDPGDPPRCGRPAGHPPAANGSPGCRSEAAVARYRRADLDRLQARREAARSTA